MGLLRMSQSCRCNDLELCPSLLKCYRSHRTDGKMRYSQENQMTGFIESLFQFCLVYIFMWSSSTNTPKGNWPHLMSKILGGLYRGPAFLVNINGLKKASDRSVKRLKGNQGLIDGDGGHGRIAGRTPYTPRFDSALRACRTPYIPLLISHCRQALRLSGTRLTPSLTAAACLDNPDQY